MLDASSITCATGAGVIEDTLWLLCRATGLWHLHQVHKGPLNHLAKLPGWDCYTEGQGRQDSGSQVGVPAIWSAHCGRGAKGCLLTEACKPGQDSLQESQGGWHQPSQGRFIPIVLMVMFAAVSFKLAFALTEGELLYCVVIFSQHTILFLCSWSNLALDLEVHVPDRQAFVVPD